jgi:hypothetical protein
MKKDEAVSRALFELRCIAEILDVIGNSILSETQSPYPWICWLGQQVDRVASELDEGMMPPPRREKASAQ